MALPRAFFGGAAVRRLVRSVIRLAGTLWLLLALAALALVLLGRPALDEPVPWFGVRSMVVLSDSMAPALRAGDAALVRTTPPEQIAAGDVITFLRNGRAVTHRVDARDSTPEGIVFLTRGDANNVADSEAVAAGQLVGRLTMVIPYGGYLVGFSRTWAGWLTLVVLPSLILMAGEAYTMRRLFQTEVRRARQEAGTRSRALRCR